ncbi:uncharacterized protein TNCT_515371 [Trichonephila clavata]|uniref:Uncharacterized protein n=1 Tax=Trichonephila clavata TaxID=2740835 RepID=A0A8X6EYB9_TRICU|nr:uncharacterized protein TNCT_515371 [Trichonephila clavata]
MYMIETFFEILIMLSAHIFKENTDITSSRNVKPNANGRPKGLGLKNSTNTSHDQKPKSGSFSDLKNFSGTLKESIPKQKLKSSLKLQTPPVIEKPEEWPETENMYIYNDSDDDYEDILPKSERITKAEIDYLFVSTHIRRFAELTVDQLPTVSLDPIEDLYDIPCHSIIDSDLLYDDSPLEFIPVPDNPFEI